MSSLLNIDFISFSIVLRNPTMGGINGGRLIWRRGKDMFDKVSRTFTKTFSLRRNKKRLGLTVVATSAIRLGFSGSMARASFESARGVTAALSIGYKTLEGLDSGNLEHNQDSISSEEKRKSRLYTCHVPKSLFVNADLASSRCTIIGSEHRTNKPRVGLG